MKIGKAITKGTLNYDTWQKVYETTLTEAATSVTISSLNGDVDEEYQLVCRFINGYNGAVIYGLRINNDSDNDYGYQDIDGTNTTYAAVRDTSESYMTLGSASTLAYLAFSNSFICAKSGYPRTMQTESVNSITTTTVTSINLKLQIYQETGNITSLVILANQTSGLGIGTNIELYKKINRI